MGTRAAVASDDPTAERVAQNQAIFRDANEGIRRAAVAHGLDGLIPFICECAKPSCTAILRLTPAEYEHVRATPTHFLTAPGHHEAAGGHAVLVRQAEGYQVAAKVGRAADVAEREDPRS